MRLLSDGRRAPSYPTKGIKERSDDKSERRRLSWGDALKQSAKSLTNPTRKRRKSDNQKIVDDLMSLEINEKNDVVDTAPMQFDFLSEVNLSYNLWFSGEIDIAENVEQDAKVVAKLLVRIDRNSHVVYNLTYRLENEFVLSEIPTQDGLYCLNFADPNQPRFKNVRYLLAYLIDKRYLQRVSFEWLIEQCV